MFLNVKVLKTQTICKFLQIIRGTLRKKKVGEKTKKNKIGNFKWYRLLHRSLKAIVLNSPER